MQVFNADQIRSWDEHTILNEPISSIDLMERASRACYDWLVKNGYSGKKYTVFCGKGNNGGDGLAIARMLSNTGHEVSVYIMEFGHKGTDDFQTNLASLHETTAEIRFLSTEGSVEKVAPHEIIIDALLGSGLNRPLQGLTAAVVSHINKATAQVVSIDVPSGLFLDASSAGNTIVEADLTLSFQCYKLAFMMAENERFIGKLHILDIGLHKGFFDTVKPQYMVVGKNHIRGMIKPRSKFAHKGDFGHGALIAGSKGMMGAAVLAARAFIRTGAGKLTCHVPGRGYDIMQISVPEAMCKTDGEDHIQSIDASLPYRAIGIGPGLGMSSSNAKLLERLFELYNKPMVIDADALNTLAANAHLFENIPKGSVLTPHPGEFEKLFGKTQNDFEKIHVALEKAKQYSVCIVLKGAYTFIATPEGPGYFNTTGNPGMATGGSGDVLTGVITSLMTQGFSSADSAIAGVYLHGVAADLGASVISEPALIPSDIINYLGHAFIQLL